MLIHFYGRIGERIGRSIEVELPDTITRVADLRRWLGQAYPDAAAELASPRLKAVVADEVVGENHPICRSDTVEFFPPLSGG